MSIPMSAARTWASRISSRLSLAALVALLAAFSPLAVSAEKGGGEANLRLPDLSSVSFLGVNGHNLLLWGILICIFGLAFGMVIYMRLKNMPVHHSMREIS